MGRDCELLTDKGLYPLDRYYVYEDLFKIDNVYTRKEGLLEINKELKFLKYRKHWLGVLKRKISKSSRFVIRDENCCYAGGYLTITKEGI